MRPADVKIAGVGAGGVVVGDDVRLVLEGNAGRGGMLDDGNVVRFPGFAAIRGAAREDSVPRSVVRPIVGCAQLVEGDVAENGVAAVVVGYRDVAGNAEVGRGGAGGGQPGAAAVGGVGDM